MIKYWKINKVNNLSEFLILNKDSIWISKINESEISIDKAIEEKKLFGKTKFYKFSDIENIMFDEDNSNFILNYLTDDDGKKEKSIKINIKKDDYNDFKNHLLPIFKNSKLSDLSFFDKNKPIIFSLLATIGIGIFLIITIGLSLKTLGILLLMTIVEIVVVKSLLKTPKNGKILKIN
ncbi:hypothetical protein ES692_17725 [Psychroserpens burtonensis]|uniref:Uncharacterized protein n=1 Tax=Psychroserpens burtonensis TaxID=49278 RepID=A0A5C7B394_9FLAO|nr:hypothetical protein [Psychroserpens burtonensis]TXE14894.1 hypothetical protein ES692_17725 [Psychroserpens burtonensis]